MAIIGLTTSLEIGDTTKQKVGTLTSISTPEFTQEAIDVTNLDSTAREFIPGMKESGEISIEGQYTKADVGQVALKSAYDSQTIDTYTVTFPDGAVFSFSGFPTTLNVIGEANLDDALGFSATIKISGEVTYTAAV